MPTKRLPEFSRCLVALRAKAGKSRYKLAQYCNLDESYILRLETGERRHPSRDTVEKLCLALVSGCSKITLDDVNSLYLAAGYAPMQKRGKGVGDSNQPPGILMRAFHATAHFFYRDDGIPALG